MADLISQALVDRGIGKQDSLVLQGYSWEQYLSIEELFSQSGVRVRFLQPYLEITAPVSLEHEYRKSHLGRLVETWCFEKQIKFIICGNATLTNPGNSGGEPDESYFFHEKKTTPDLVIEVALTSGGLSKRAFYASLNVPELWIWRNDALEVHQLNEAKDGYDQIDESVQLQGINLSDVEECAVMEFASEAVIEFKKRLAKD